MRQITREAMEAFCEGRRFKKSNMEVTGDSMYLHGNKIAWWDKNNQLWISDCGWPSKTTMEKLNALPNVNIIQRNYQWYLNGEPWNGQAICIGRVC